MSREQRIVSVVQVSKQFGSVRAVDDVSFEVERRSFFSLLGPSGCGKTTLLRMLAGFIAPTNGEILIDDVLMTDVPPNKRPTNMVFQNYAIFPHLNVASNIAYGLRAKNLSRAELSKAVGNALDLIKMKGYGSRRAHELSGGERQRVALARAIVCRPKVLLLDEPLGALDRRLREEMQLELREIQRNVGITFVLVTHDQDEALTMSDRIAVMSNGRILQIADPTELYESPNCKEVASFIGKMNFFNGVVSACVDNQVLVDVGSMGTFRVSSRLAVGPGQKVTIAVRPEKMVLSEEEPDHSYDRLQGRIEAQAYLGDRSHFYVDVCSPPCRVAVARQNVYRAVEAVSAESRSVWISWLPEQAVLLTK